MSENTCPNVALSRNQNMWVVKESADKTLGFPAVTDIINAVRQKGDDALVEYQSGNPNLRQQGKGEYAQ